MLLPYRDNLPIQRRPFVTWTLIIVNIVLFLQYGLPSFDNGLALYGDLELAWDRWGLFANLYDPLQTWPRLFTHLFLHGGWIHLAGNMLVLYIFGNNLEDKLGHIWFLVFYLACGLAGGLAFLITETDPALRAGGASGAIAGVMGGYLLLFPRATIMSLLLLPNILWPYSILIRLFWKLQIWGYWPILFLTFGIPAWIYLGFWVIWNILGAMIDPVTSQIGYASHLGGFVAGVVFIFFVTKQRKRHQNKMSEMDESMAHAQQWENPGPPHPQQRKEMIAASKVERQHRGPWNKSETGPIKSMEGVIMQAARSQEVFLSDTSPDESRRLSKRGRRSLEQRQNTPPIKWER